MDSSSNQDSANRELIAALPIRERLEMLRQGALGAREVADFAADAGSQNFIEAETEVNQLLDHADPIVRFNALSTIAYEWGRSSRLERIVEILRNDADDDCRRQAAGALGSLNRGTKDRTVLSQLIAAASDPAETSGVRAFAYVSALDVIGIPRTEQPNPRNLEITAKELEILERLRV